MHPVLQNLPGKSCSNSAFALCLSDVGGWRPERGMGLGVCPRRPQHLLLGNLCWSLRETPRPQNSTSMFIWWFCWEVNPSTKKCVMIWLNFLCHVQFAGFMGVGMIVMMIFGIMSAVGKEQVIYLDTFLSLSWSYCSLSIIVDIDI